MDPTSPALVRLALLIGGALRGGTLGRARFHACVDRLWDEGRQTAAVEAVRKELNRAGPVPWLVNLSVETLINAGKYSEALSLPAPTVRAEGPVDAGSLLLVQINLSEAEYNLGDWTAALERLRGLDEAAAPFALARAGLALQRAWILAHTGRGEQALSAWAEADIDGLPHRYRAEHYFTHAALLLALQRPEEAGDAARDGAAAAVRASSARNSLYVMARVAAAKGELARADSLCGEAAGHRYRGQGGDGLLLWGDVLARLGRPDAARRAYEWAVSRDEESESARTARARLRTIDGGK